MTVLGLRSLTVCAAVLIDSVEQLQGATSLQQLVVWRACDLEQLLFILRRVLPCLSGRLTHLGLPTLRPSKIDDANTLLSAMFGAHEHIRGANLVTWWYNLPPM